MLINCLFENDALWYFTLLLETIIMHRKSVDKNTLGM